MNKVKTPGPSACRSGAFFKHLCFTQFPSILHRLKQAMRPTLVSYLVGVSQLFTLIPKPPLPSTLS